MFARGFITLLLIHLVCLAASSKPTLQVVATLPVLKNLTEEIGGPFVEVDSLSHPLQDPHFIQPKPTLTKKVSKADAMVEIGLDLELWLQKAIDASGNKQIQRGQPGRIIASQGIPPLDPPKIISRSWGDIHPQGNPHIWLDPLRVKLMAFVIAKGLSRVDPAHQAAYQEKANKLSQRIDTALFGESLLKEKNAKELIKQLEKGNLPNYLKENKLSDKLVGWLKKADKLKEKSLVCYHPSWTYLTQRFGIQIAAQIEDKPGIAPSAKHREALIRLIKEKNIQVILLEPFYDDAPAKYIAAKTGATILKAPIDISEQYGIHNYFELIDYVLDELLKRL